MRAGRSVDSPITKDNLDGHVIAYFNADTLVRGLAEALAAAVREGVAVSRIAGQVTYRTAHLTATVDTLATRTELLEQKLHDARRRERRARSFALDAEDDDAAASYARAGRDARAEVRRFTAELELLRTATPDLPGGQPFTAFVDVLLAAIRRLASSENAVSQEEANALETVMPEFSLERDDIGRWWGSATIRLSTEDGVAELGPIRWRVRDRSRGSTALRSLVRPTHQSGASRNELRALLRTETDLPVSAVRTLLNAPFPQLPYVVLHGCTGHPFPDWVDAQWRERLFVDWVARRYGDPTYPWVANGQYVTVSYLRQYVAHVVAQRGSATPQEVAATLDGLSARSVVQVSKDQATARGVWRPGVVVELQPPGPDGPGPRTAAHWARHLRMFPVECMCGSPATVMARVAEVPRNVLCECGRMPDPADYGMDPDLVFPREYASMQFSKAACAAQLIQARQDDRWAPRGRTALVLQQSDLLRGGVTARDLATILGLEQRQLHPSLTLLESRGVIRRGPGKPARWTLTEGA